MSVELGPAQGFPRRLSEVESMRRLCSEEGASVFADNTAALAVEAAAAAAAVAAAGADLGPPSEEGNDSEEDPCP